ncbi:hypothetical protein JNUCC1_00259 [Lentibacillus sp. JNUCC-1]|nr:hypothetical protein [Lentibacillus sp. JNUCC-1]
MIPGGSLNSSTNIKIPLSFIILGLTAFVGAQIILLFNYGELSISQFRTPAVWSGAHVLLLGFAVMVAMGAMYQLVPVAFLTPIWNETFAVIQLVITAIGFGVFSVLLFVNPGSAVYGGACAVIGILFFVFQMFKTLLVKQDKNTMFFFVIGALVALFAAIIGGFMLALHLAGASAGNHQPILFSHIALGAAGWFTLLIFGFSYKLVPMFSLSHGYSESRSKPALLFYGTGLIILIGSFWTSISVINMIGWGLLFTGFLLFALDIREILAKRLRKRLDKPFAFSLFAIPVGLTLHGLALVLSLFHVTNAAVWSWLVFLYVMGWVVLSILGYLYKIVPFLWWTHKYANMIGKEKVPTLKDMINEKRCVYVLSSFIIAVLGITISALAGSGMFVLLFQTVLVVTALIYALSVIKIFFV